MPSPNGSDGAEEPPAPMDHRRHRPRASPPRAVADGPERVEVLPETIPDSGPPLPPAAPEAASADAGKGPPGPEQVDVRADAARPLPPAALEDVAAAAKVGGHPEQIDDGAGPPLPAAAFARGVEQIDGVEQGPPPPPAFEGAAREKKGGAPPGAFRFDPALYEERMGRKVAPPLGDGDDATGAAEREDDERVRPDAGVGSAEAEAARENDVGDGGNATAAAREGDRAGRSNADGQRGQEPGDVAITVPEAFLVEDDDDNDIFVDAFAEPLPPWWKQRRTRMLLAAMIVVVLVAAAAVGATASRERTVTSVETVAASSPPSVSAAPSMSAMPSAAPTSCWVRASSVPHRLELPIPDPSYQQFRVYGRHAVVAARRLSGSVHLAFYSLQPNGGWARTSSFIEEYPDAKKAPRQQGPFRPAESGFHVSLSGDTALLGLSRFETEAGTGAGVVYLYERGALGNWTKTAEPLLPRDGGVEGGHFGYSNGVHDSTVVACSINERAIRMFQRSGNGWEEATKLKLSYSPFFCWIKHSSIVVVDMDSNRIHFYYYNRDLQATEILQDSLVVNPGIEGFGSWTDQLVATGTSKQISDIAVSEDYLIFTTSAFELAWVPESVSIYKRGEGAYSLLQTFNASDYEDGNESSLQFGREVAQDNNVLIIGGEGRTWMFADGSGYFEEALRLEESHDEYWLSGRTMTVASGAELSSFSLEDCLPAMGTSMPSSSLAPSVLSPSPSQAPTITPVPSKSMLPSHAPTLSSAPSVCYEVSLLLQTCDDAEVFAEGVASWELYQKQAETAIQSSSPLEANKTYSHTFPCLQAGSYAFNITNKAGLGFGLCERGGYFIAVDGDVVGGNAGAFWDNEVLNFPVPYVRAARDSEKEFALCSFDFYLTLVTEEIPEDISWTLTDEEGSIVLQGGPYDKPLSINTEYSCLEDGKYNFTIANAGWTDTSSRGDWIGGYALATNESQILAYVEGHQIDETDSTIFVVGTHTELAQDSATDLAE